MLSADNARVVTAGDDQTARIWDVATGRQLTLPLTHQAGLRSARFSQDGTRIVTTALDRTVRIWDATTGGLVVPPLEHPDSVLSAVLSPDDTRVATISHDRSVRLWDATTGKLLAAPFEHPGALQGVAFSPDGAHLLVASDDGAHLRDVAADDQPLAAWQATAERGPYVLAGGVVAPRASLITASPSAQPAFSAGPTSSCPRPRSGQTAAIRP